MGMINGLRTLNALTSGTMTAAQLETHLASGTNLGSFRQLLQLRGQSAAMASSSVAMIAVVGSSVAMNAVSASSVARAIIGVSGVAYNMVAASAMAIGKYVAGGAGLDPSLYADIYALTASSTVMSSVAASSAAMAVVAGSAVAKMALFNSDTALNAVAPSAIALAALRAAAQYAVYASASAAGDTSRALAGLTAAGSYLVLGASTSDGSAGFTQTVSTLRTGSARPATNVTAAGNTSLTTALGPIVMPMVTPFAVTSTRTTIQIGYVGALRCDV